MLAMLSSSASRLQVRSDWIWVPFNTRKSAPSRVRKASPSGCSRQLKRQSSLPRSRWRAVKQRAEKASGMRPYTNNSVCMPAGRRASIAASAVRPISSGGTQRRAPSLAITARLSALYRFRWGPAMKGVPGSMQWTAPMSLASI